MAGSIGKTFWKPDDLIKKLCSEKTDVCYNMEVLDVGYWSKSSRKLHGKGCCKVGSSLFFSTEGRNKQRGPSTANNGMVLYLRWCRTLPTLECNIRSLVLTTWEL